MTRPLLARQVPQDAVMDRRVTNLEMRSLTKQTGLRTDTGPVSLQSVDGGSTQSLTATPTDLANCEMVVKGSAAMVTANYHVRSVTNGWGTAEMQLYLDGVSAGDPGLILFGEYTDAQIVLSKTCLLELTGAPQVLKIRTYKHINAGSVELVAGVTGITAIVLS